MTSDFERFRKPKPPAFPFRIDVRPENHWKLDDSDFQDVLEKKYNIAKNTNIDGKITPRVTQNKEEKSTDIRLTRELSKLLSEFDNDVNISISSNKIVFIVGDIIFISKLIDGSFPDYLGPGAPRSTGVPVPGRSRGPRPHQLVGALSQEYK